MRYQGDITEREIWIALDDIYTHNNGDDVLFTQRDIAELIASRRQLPLGIAARSVRDHFKRLQRKGTILKYGNDDPVGMGRPQALYMGPEYYVVRQLSGTRDSG